MQKAVYAHVLLYRMNLLAQEGFGEIFGLAQVEPLQGINKFTKDSTLTAKLLCSFHSVENLIIACTCVQKESFLDFCLILFYRFVAFLVTTELYKIYRNSDVLKETRQRLHAFIPYA